ncbi:GlxA family transcriptional regulator [Rahnella sikkimica]|uniref:AraC family transcriptional regulator n=1 Tax=Rahnella sikkimica TaxID=1805933 RepID=A0A2L1UNL1_9GAMM|nr:helix-turn-helix domain-containing protein [Rahnella sikkimica]AVF34502.1 AraC family transcriptional regulator [Rahnella sikkimica]
MPKHIIILAVPGVQLLDVSGPLDVFAEANQQRGREVYKLSVMAVADPIVVSSSGARLLADLTLDAPLPYVLDTFLVAGAPVLDSFISDEKLHANICRWSHHAQRFGSVCSGAMLLAAAGLINGRRVTTHWTVAERLHQEYPQVTVEADAIFIADAELRTAAGVTSGLDLALNMVEEDLGRETALDVAAQLVMFFKRPGGQLQFSRHGQASLSGRSALQDVQRWVLNSLDQPHNVQSLATHMGISARHMTRLFNQELNQSPAEWLEQQRVFHARQLLETGELGVKQIAAECGFSSVDILRRAFVRQLFVTPSQYQKNHSH